MSQFRLARNPRNGGAIKYLKGSKFLLSVAKHLFLAISLSLKATFLQEVVVIASMDSSTCTQKVLLFFPNKQAFSLGSVPALCKTETNAMQSLGTLRQDVRFQF